MSLSEVTAPLKTREHFVQVQKLVRLLISFCVCQSNMLLRCCVPSLLNGIIGCRFFPLHVVATSDAISKPSAPFQDPTNRMEEKKKRGKKRKEQNVWFAHDVRYAPLNWQRWLSLLVCGCARELQYIA